MAAGGARSTGPQSLAATPAASAASDAFTLFPNNPSVGLQLLTPLVPAADNRTALWLLSTAQLLFGVSLMTRRIPKMPESRLRARLSSMVRFTAGLGVVFMSGLEYARLLVPYDPWADEARQWRQWATRNGQNPSWWYGGIMHYNPMSMLEWKHKTVTWIHNTQNVLEAVYEAEELPADETLAGVQIGPHAVLKGGDSKAYSEIYQNLQRINQQRTRELLEGDLKDVSELNKAERLDAVLEGKGKMQLNKDYSKPSIQMGHHTMDTPPDFELIWANFEPWDELLQEVDYDIRLIPRWRCFEE